MTTPPPPEGAVAINDPSHWGTAVWLQVAAIIAVVVILHVPLGNYLARVYSAIGDWRIERTVYTSSASSRMTGNGGRTT